MYEDVGPRLWSRSRLSPLLDKAESFYLRVLRAVILIIATLLLGYAAWLAATSLYKISRSPQSVHEQEASVAADELTDAQMPATRTASTASTPNRANTAQASFYSSFVDRYYSLYRARFEPYRQAEDKQLSKSEFDGAFLNTAARQKAISTGELNFDNDRRDLESLLTTMQAAAAKPKSIERLKRYQAARKVPVKEQVQRTRVETVAGWDSSSTSCPNWYESPYGCPAKRTVEVPYTETVTTMKYPDNTQSHIQIFKAFQDRYFELLDQRRDANAREAQRKRENILSGIAEGHLSLATALQVLAGFLVLMFFFLLIAIERHQRRLADAPPQVAAE